MCFETSLTEAASNSLNAVHFLAAFAITVLLFGFFTGIQVLYVKRRRQREAVVTPSSSSARSMSETIRKSLPSRLFLSGLLALLVLVLQQTVWSSRTLKDDGDDDNNNNDTDKSGVDWWIIFLFVDGVVVALMLIAMNHILYWSYCHANRDGPPCDETVAVSECDEEEFDFDKGMGQNDLATSDGMMDQEGYTTVDEELIDQGVLTATSIQLGAVDLPRVARLDEDGPDETLYLNDTAEP